MTYAADERIDAYIAALPGRAPPSEDIKVVMEWLLPGLLCSCCETVTFAEPPPPSGPGRHWQPSVCRACPRAPTKTSETPLPLR